MAIVQGDRTALNVSYSASAPAAPSAEERDLCLRQVVTDANGIFSGVNERTQTALTTLRSIVDRLSQTTTPKTIVYISEGLVLERPGDGAWLGPAAARGQVTHLRPPTRSIRLGRLDGAGAGRRPGATGRSRTKGSASSPARRAARSCRWWPTPTTRSRAWRSSSLATTS